MSDVSEEDAALSKLDDPLAEYAWSQTSIDCTECDAHFAVPPETCRTEDDVVRWAPRAADDARSRGWIAIETRGRTLLILCPACAASHANI